MVSLWHFICLSILPLVNGITITVDTAQSSNPATNAIDQKNGTFWHSQYTPTTPLPHVATLDLLVSSRISGFTYLPRQDNVDGGSKNGNIGQHDVEISDDNVQWITVISNGSYADNKVLKTENFPTVQARYVRITAKTEAGNRGPWSSAAEFGVILESTNPSSSSSSLIASTSSSISSSSSISTSSTIEISSSSTQLSTSTTVTSSATSTTTGILSTVSASISKIVVDSFQGGNEAGKAIDNNYNTFWDARWSPVSPLPHNAVLDLGLTALPVVGLTYYPRQDGGINGNIGQYAVDTSIDGTTWALAYSGTFVDNTLLKTVQFPQVLARYVRLTAITEAGNRGPWTSASELGVLVLSDIVIPLGPSRGSWGSVIPLEIVAAAAFLIPETGAVMVFAASGLTDFNAKGHTNTATYNPLTGAVSKRDVRSTEHDMFCPGLSLDFNGRAIITGGNNNDKVTIYSPFGDAWTKTPKMTINRGYQSSTTLSDGRIFTIGGSWLDNPGRGNKNGEVFDVNTNTWSLLPGAPVAPMLTKDAGKDFRTDNHAWLFAWKDASVFQAGPSTQMNWYGTFGNGSQSTGGSRGDPDSMCGIAVMYDAVAGKIFTAGGSPSYEASRGTTNAHLITIEAMGTNATATSLTSMTYNRAYHNGVVLPDGKVFVTGGQAWAVPFSDTSAIMQPEMWDPETLSFTLLPRHQIPRTYHSIALLLLDGTVFTGGGGLCGAGCNTNHLDAEIFSPGYLFKLDGTAATRPVINSVSATTVAIGSTVTVATNSAVTKFSLIRYGSVTHTVNTDQRRIPVVPTSSLDGLSHTFTIPADSGVALPGYWMLFALNAAGVPSVAKTLKLTLV